MFLHQIEFTRKIKIAQRIYCRNNSAISHILSVIGANNMLSLFFHFSDESAVSVKLHSPFEVIDVKIE